MMRGNPFMSMNNNPIQMMRNVVQQARQIQGNPSKIGQLLLDNGRIDKDTYNAIKDMKSPAQIGNYLMDNGILGQNQAQRYAQMAPQIQQMMNA